MKQTSIWIGIHAIEQFAWRVFRIPKDQLTSAEKDTYRALLLDLYRNSKEIYESHRKYRRAKNTDNKTQRLCYYRYESGLEIEMVLICAPDNVHSSGALKLVTVYKTGQRLQE